MSSHVFTGTYNGAKFDAEFADKRSYNSFVNNMEKAKKINISYKCENSSSSEFRSMTPDILDGFKIVNKFDHIALIPPNSTKEEIEITPTFQYTWSPTLKGRYWNDGMYHFFPIKSQIKMSMTVQDIVQNMLDNGAVDQ